MEEALIKSKSSSIHRSLTNSSERKGAYRFLSNEKVSEELLMEDLFKTCEESVKDKKVIALCDTSTFNFTSHKGRITDFTGLGSLGRVNGTHPLGFLMHPILVHERHSGIPLGISALKLWDRPNQAKRDRSKRYKTKDLFIEEKESFKWLGPCLSSRDNSLKEAKHITFVMDREGDIMEVFDRLPNEKTDVLVRAKHNRNVLTQSGENEKLIEYLNRQEVCFTDQIKLKSRKRKKRIAEVEVKIAKCTLCWHKRQKVSWKNNPDGVQVNIIEVKERTHKGHSSEAPLIWRLITTSEIENVEQVKEQIRIYEQRWRIEEFFKLLKSDGFDIESTELESGKSIRKLIIIIMKVSIKIQQLKAAREGTTDLKVSDVFNEEEIECLNQVNNELGGTTVKQQNPHDKTNLAWATWIIARLGGWKEFYNKSRPPGHKTLIWGLDKFEGIMIGYNIFRKKDVYQR